MHQWMFIALIHLLLSLGSSQKLIRLPSKTECRSLASHENCMTDIMQEYCRPACTEQHHFEVLIQSGIVSIPKVESFYDLHALDIQENPVDFKQFRGKVVLVTNVASYCGYTKEHYKQMISLHSKFRGDGFEILAFPCNQFREQEPDSNSEIQEFCDKKGVEFRVMDKIDVNGPETHDVYRYLKHKVGPEKIDWNFGTYYLIGRRGKIKAYHGISPESLENDIAAAIRGEMVGS